MTIQGEKGPAGSIAWGRQRADGEVLLSPAWEVFILGVSILSVFNLAVVWVLDNPDITTVFIVMDSILMLIFLLDLLRRLEVADSARRSMGPGRGWIDLEAAFPSLRVLRVIRVVRMVNIMGRLGGPLQAFRAFFSNRAAGGLLAVLLVGLLVLEFGAVAMLAVERTAPGATIVTASDAVWYLLVTMSTVGYGDVYPVTDLGRLIGSLIIVVGVGTYGTLTGFLANAFLAPSEAAAAVLPIADQETEAEPNPSVATAADADQPGT